MAKGFQLTPDQARAVAERRNAVVTAGAGTGKTRVLAERFCDIMKQQNIGIDQILTLTFTNKATTEMQERIYQTLGAVDNSYIQRELERFHTASITTFDSFCRSLIEGQLLALGYPAQPVQEQAQIKQGAEDAIFTFFLQNRRDSDLQLLRDVLGTDHLRDNVFLPLALDHMHPSRSLNFTTEYEEYEQHLMRLIEAHIAQFNTHVDSGVLSTLIDNPTHLLSVQEQCFERSLEEYYNLFYGPSKLRLNKEQKEVRQCVDSISTAYRWYQRRPITQKLFSLLGRFQEFWLKEKQQRGFLSFKDALYLSIDLLKSNPALRAEYNRKFQYIMVDEVQDNNRQQWELLFLLALPPNYRKKEIPQVSDLRKGVLFCVGDKKQSIYRFRGAEPDIFTQLGESLVQAGGGQHLLMDNFRTEPDLINWFNQLFSPRMEGYEAISPGTASVDGVSPEVLFIGELKDNLPIDPKLSDAKQEAWEIAHYLKDMIAQGRIVRTDKGPRPVSFEDVAVLFITTTKQQEFEEVFKRLDIPYSVESAKTLYLEAPVLDAVYMVQLALQSYDQSYLARVLRSPYFGCDDSTVVSLLLQKQPFDQLDLSELPSSEVEKIHAGKELLKRVVQMVDRHSHCTVFRMLWYQSGYRYWLLQEKKSHSYLEHYYYLQSLAASAESRGIPMFQFLHELMENFGSGSKVEENPLLPIRKGVSLMTVHKSKGLEFPVVVIPRLTQNKQPYRASPCVVTSEYGVIINPGAPQELDNPFAESLRVREKELAQEEQLRLFYVAVTRAKSHIICTGVIPKKISKESLLSYLVEDSDSWESFENSQGIQKVKKMSEIPLDIYRRQGSSKKRTPQTMFQHYQEQTPLIVPCKDLTVAEINALYNEGFNNKKSVALPPLPVDTLVWDKTFYGKFGTLCHKIIELKLKGLPIPEYPCDEQYWQGSYDLEIWDIIRNDASKLVVAYLEKEGTRLQSLPTSSEQSIIISYESLLKEDCIIPSSLCSSGCSTQEFNKIISENYGSTPQVILGQIDLVVELEDRVLIIDFKSNKEKREAQYSMQMALYAYGARKIFEKPIETELVYLREYLV